MDVSPLDHTHVIRRRPAMWIVLVYALAAWAAGVAINHADLATMTTSGLEHYNGAEQARMTEHGIWLLSTCVHYGVAALALGTVATVALIVSRTGAVIVPTAPVATTTSR
ncbi:hypothetical protein [Georgenia faecalis]|uniref:DUF998 domain-containing protein n=1 Tax=Georgenia faecalis TaxID=2483799 RepID=A0ABV9D559_9MICO|nr:hypothetical protein [Georgenia faecalis]